MSVKQRPARLVFTLPEGLRHSLEHRVAASGIVVRLCGQSFVGVSTFRVRLTILTSKKMTNAMITIDQGPDNLSKRRADDHGHGEIHNVSTSEKFFEFLQHELSPYGAQTEVCI
jgi:hypothetical protein